MHHLTDGVVSSFTNTKDCRFETRKAVNITQMFEIFQEPTGKNCNGCDGSIHALEEEVPEIKAKMEVSQISEK